MFWLVSLAFARPTEGGMWAFEEADVVVSYDAPGGAARVWYSAEGPNVVKAFVLQ